MAAKQPIFSPKQVAESLDVSESSVKRWCDRGAIPVVKTSGGHRRITLDALRSFLETTNRCRLSRPEVLGFPVLARTQAERVPGSDGPLHQRFRLSLTSGDEEGCRETLQAKLQEGCSRSEAIENLVMDAMHGIGKAWECRELSVYQERRACLIALRLIHEMRSEIPPPANDAPVAIGGAPEGDPYELPTAMIELALREIGWNAVSLGCNVPLVSLSHAAEAMQPKLFWLSVSGMLQPEPFIAAQNQFANSLHEDTTLVIGGRAVCEQVRPRLRYTAHCEGLQHLVEVASVLQLGTAS